MTVTVETDQPSTLTLTDATGRECGQWKVGNGKTTLDISPLRGCLLRPPLHIPHHKKTDNQIAHIQNVNNYETSHRQNHRRNVINFSK